MFRWIMMLSTAAALAGCSATSGTVPAQRAAAASHPSSIMLGTGY